MSLLEIIGAVSLVLYIIIAALWTAGIIEFGSVEVDEENEE